MQLPLFVLGHVRDVELPSGAYNCIVPLITSPSSRWLVSGISIRIDDMLAGTIIERNRYDLQDRPTEG